MDSGPYRKAAYRNEEIASVLRSADIDPAKTPIAFVDKKMTESDATSLINGVRDVNAIAVGPNPEQVYRVAAQLRAQRLDMFADGLQDWIGLPETSFPSNSSASSLGRHKSETTPRPT